MHPRRRLVRGLACPPPSTQLRAMLVPPHPTPTCSSAHPTTSPLDQGLGHTSRTRRLGLLCRVLLYPLKAPILLPAHPISTIDELGLFLHLIPSTHPVGHRLARPHTGHTHHLNTPDLHVSALSCPLAGCVASESGAPACPATLVRPSSCLPALGMGRPPRTDCRRHHHPTTFPSNQRHVLAFEHRPRHGHFNQRRQVP